MMCDARRVPLKRGPKSGPMQESEQPVAADVRRLQYLFEERLQPPYVGCYDFLNPPGRQWR